MNFDKVLNRIFGERRIHFLAKAKVDNHELGQVADETRLEIREIR